MKTNTKVKNTRTTHEGAPAKMINAEQELRRSVMSCLLWEDTFYEDGESIADRVTNLIPKVHVDKVADIVHEARHYMKLRHMPLFMIRQMARLDSHKSAVSNLLETTINRPDEITEFMAMYWADGKQSISAQVKKGLAKAFTHFDAYQLAKYDRANTVKMQDVMFMVHPKATSSDQQAIWDKLIAGTLESPDTWEVNLSTGEDKKETWERLMSNNKLGAMALLRNLRNMSQVGVDEDILFTALESMNVKYILPFRFITAARYAPQWEPQIEQVMFRCLKEQKKLPGKTVLLVDVSGSMNATISQRSEVTRLDCAYGLAILLREICNDVQIYSFSNSFNHIPARRGFALRDAIDNSQTHAGTPLGQAINCIYGERGKTIKPNNRMFHRGDHTYKGQGLNPDRLIVITDEQAGDVVPDPQGLGYIINVSSFQNGVGYGPWTHIDGWSESIINYIQEKEGANL